MKPTTNKTRAIQNTINYACKLCEFNTSNKYNFDIHLLRPKHLRLKDANEKRVNEASKKPLECKDCNYICSTQFNLDRHFSTIKHKKNVEKLPPVKKTYPCPCGKTYKHASSLTKHSYTCNREIVSSAVGSTWLDTAGMSGVQLWECLHKLEACLYVFPQAQGYTFLIGVDSSTFFLCFGVDKLRSNLYFVKHI